MSNRKDELDRLCDGDFTNIDISKYVGNYEFDSLQCVAHGCTKNGNTNILYILYLIINSLGQNPNAKDLDRDALCYLIKDSGVYPNMDNMTEGELQDYWNSRIIDGCNQVMRQVVASSVELEDKRCTEIINNLSLSDNTNYRLFCCCHVNNPISFLNDEDERIRKVANIRVSFSKRWDSYSEDEKEFVTFLKEAISSKTIDCYDGLVGGHPSDIITAKFDSILFDNYSTGYIDFDADIFYNIKDQRILADALYQMYCNNELSFRDEMKPTCLKEIEKDREKFAVKQKYDRKQS